MENNIKISEGMLRCNKSCENWDVGTLLEFNFQSFVDLGTKFGVLDEVAEKLRVELVDASDLKSYLGYCLQCEFKTADQLLILFQCCVFGIYEENYTSEYLIEVTSFSLNNMSFTLGYLSFSKQICNIKILEVRSSVKLR